MMLKTSKKERAQYELICIDDLVPKDHILRKIDAATDFTHIYDLVGELYSPNNGRPSIDPVVIFKMTMIQHIFGIPSLRKTAEEVKLNVGYRWFLGYSLSEQTPHFSILSYNFRNRYTPEIVEEIFYWILSEIEKAVYLEPETVFVDGTHIKANDNMKKAVKKAVPKAAKIYEEQLLRVVHELAHIKCREHWWKPPGSLLLAVYRFNPLIWLASVLLCRDTELACDENVIKNLDNEQRADYTQAILTCSVNHRVIAVYPLAFGEVGAKERVKSVLHYKKQMFWVVMLAVIVCTAAAVCFLTDPVAAEDATNQQENSVVKWFDYLEAPEEMRWDGFLETNKQPGIP